MPSDADQTEQQAPPDSLTETPPAEQGVAEETSPPADVMPQETEAVPEEAEPVPEEAELVGEPTEEPVATGVETVAEGAPHLETLPPDADEPVEPPMETVSPGAVDVGEAEAPPQHPHELMPGEYPSEPVVPVLDDATAQGFRIRWREVQLRFVDDPRLAASDAGSLVHELIDTLENALATRGEELDAWRATAGRDTEVMRAAVCRYRDLFDRVLGL